MLIQKGNELKCNFIWIARVIIAYYSILFTSLLYSLFYFKVSDYEVFALWNYEFSYCSFVYKNEIPLGEQLCNPFKHSLTSEHTLPLPRNIKFIRRFIKKLNNISTFHLDLTFQIYFMSFWGFTHLEIHHCMCS